MSYKRKTKEEIARMGVEFEKEFLYRNRMAFVPFITSTYGKINITTTEIWDEAKRLFSEIVGQEDKEMAIRQAYEYALTDYNKVINADGTEVTNNSKVTVNTIFYCIALIFYHEWYFEEDDKRKFEVPNPCCGETHYSMTDEGEEIEETEPESIPIHSVIAQVIKLRATYRFNNDFVETFYGRYNADHETEFKKIRYVGRVCADNEANERIKSMIKDYARIAVNAIENDEREDYLQIWTILVEDDAIREFICKNSKNEAFSKNKVFRIIGEFNNPKSGISMSKTKVHQEYSLKEEKPPCKNEFSKGVNDEAIRKRIKELVEGHKIRNNQI